MIVTLPFLCVDCVVDNDRLFFWGEFANDGFVHRGKE